MTDLLTIAAKALTDAVGAIEGKGAHVGMNYTQSVEIDVYPGLSILGEPPRLLASVYGLRTYVDVVL